MEEFISRKFNIIYNIIIIGLLFLFFFTIFIVIITYLDEIIEKNKYDVLSFLIFFILILIFFIRLNYHINEIVINYEDNTVIIKKIFSKKIFKINEIDKIDKYILPYLNYIKVKNKNYLFISRSIDPFGDNFTFDLEGDLENIRESINNNKFDSKSLK